jgi:DNA mismatch repair protein MutS2
VRELSSSPDPSELEDKTAADLEWPLLLDRLARHCMSAHAGDRLRQIRPLGTLEEARERMLLVGEALALSERGERLPVQALPELRALLERVRRGAVASGVELRELSSLLTVARALRTYAREHCQEHTRLAAALRTDATLDTLLERVQEAVADDGTVRDDASPELRKARRRVADTRQQLTTELGRAMKRYASVLRDQYFTEHDGRYTLPVRADAHLRVPGIVHGASASGGTLYVEPHEVTGVGNQLRMAHAEAEREEARVLGDLTNLARSKIDALDAARETCIEADVLLALARWATEVGARTVVPDPTPSLKVRAMRHPLLIRPDVPVVPNDLELDDATVLVISGPNAGGKTVALKCIGLAVWMARSGIPLPVAADSCVGWFDPVLMDIGDDQSLMQSLSTFSGHVARLSQFLARAQDHTLVLIDEVVAGTDPEEGSVLAVAVLEGLLQRRATVAVTTHFERLKQLATDDDRFVNASVGFDFEHMAPTFQLHSGIPGASSALAVAARFGMPEEVVARAQALIPEEATRLRDLLESVQAERSRLQAARDEAERDARRHAELLAEIEIERRHARKREEQRLIREARDLELAVRQARGHLVEAKRRLACPELTSEDVRQAERMVDEAAHPIAVGGQLAQLAMPAPSETGLRPAQADQLPPGTRVYLPKLGSYGETLDAPTRGQVRVLAGALKLVVAVEDVEHSSAGPSRRSQQRQARGSSARAQKGSSRTVSDFSPVRTQGNTLDLRGERVDDALDRLDAFLDSMLAQGEPAGFVLHGHGTGKLKTAVRAHLQSSVYVERSQPAGPEDGGDAFTLFWVRT